MGCGLIPLKALSARLTLLQACEEQGLSSGVSHPGEGLASGRFQEKVTWEKNDRRWESKEEGGRAGSRVLEPNASSALHSFSEAFLFLFSHYQSSSVVFFFLRQGHLETSGSSLGRQVAARTGEGLPPSCSHLFHSPASTSLPPSIALFMIDQPPPAS